MRGTAVGPCTPPHARIHIGKEVIFLAPLLFQVPSGWQDFLKTVVPSWIRPLVKTWVGMVFLGWSRAVTSVPRAGIETRSSARLRDCRLLSGSVPPSTFPRRSPGAGPRGG